MEWWLPKPSLSHQLELYVIQAFYDTLLPWLSGVEAQNESINHELQQLWIEIIKTLQRSWLQSTLTPPPSSSKHLCSRKHSTIPVPPFQIPPSRSGTPPTEIKPSSTSLLVCFGCWTNYHDLGRSKFRKKEHPHHQQNMTQA